MRRCSALCCRSGWADADMDDCSQPTRDIRPGACRRFRSCRSGGKQTFAAHDLNDRPLDEWRCDSDDILSGRMQRGLIPAPTTLPTRLSTAAATHGLFRAYHPPRRAAVVAPTRIAAFSPSTVRAPSQRRPPPAASKPRAGVKPRRRWRKVRMGGTIARNGPSSYWECLGIVRGFRSVRFIVPIAMLL